MPAGDLETKKLLTTSQQKGNKKFHGAKHVELFILVGDNRIELVPQRTSFEGAKRRANDRERGCRRLNEDEKKDKEEKRPHGAKHVKSFQYGGR